LVPGIQCNITARQYRKQSPAARYSQDELARHGQKGEDPQACDSLPIAMVSVTAVCPCTHYRSDAGAAVIDLPWMWLPSQPPSSQQVCNNPKDSKGPGPNQTQINPFPRR